ncbi:MAG: hypothetical protein ABI832_22550 [bacterium]
MAATANEDFLARLDRIRAQDGEHVLMVGLDEQIAVPRKELRQFSRSVEVASNALYPAGLFGALLLGMLGVALGNYVRFQLMAGNQQLQDPGIELIFISGFGLITSFVLSQAFRLTTKLQRTLQGMGVFLMVGIFHNFSHWLPVPMTVAFSADYVLTTTAATPRNSFRFGQQYFPLFDQTNATDPTAATSTETTQTPGCTPNKPQLLVLDGKVRKTVQEAEAPVADPCAGK